MGVGGGGGDCGVGTLIAPSPSTLFCTDKHNIRSQNGDVYFLVGLTPPFPLLISPFNLIPLIIMTLGCLCQV